MSVSLQREAFDVGKEIGALTAGRHDIGAVASFVGLVREINSAGGTLAGEGNPLSAMTLEHYPGMTEHALEEIVAEAHQRWKLLAVRVLHRFGRLLPGEAIVLVIVAGAHRGEAFAACEFIMDYLKTQAPFWKKEEGADATAAARWVDARASDDAAARRWNKQ
ncbi:MAG: molybdenum cofactor biosynthesis protein MoaE [Rhodocyclaceae bacterium]|nr:MAG: molybdenum cofactor biosynthesis protein MoaE [Rhodocyclaceae bacterium]